jgi:3-deoxy-7-phosphoheptulonate synthase
MLRGGAFKPRTNPYSFQGLGLEGLKFLEEARAETGLPFATEVTGEDKIDVVVNAADMIQIGTRNMRSYDLLKAIGERTAAAAPAKGREKPVLLKRGDNATLEEFLNAAEYIAKEGNENICLCLRGIRTFESDKFMRNTPDLGMIPVIKAETGLPVLFDPSHSTGHRQFVANICYAAVAAGADGLLVETHPCPESAKCDGQQSVSCDDIGRIIEKARRIYDEVHAGERPAAG